MDKVYNHSLHEQNIYSLWEKSGAFTPKVDKKKKPFTIIMPPPNARGEMRDARRRESTKYVCFASYLVPSLLVPVFLGR